MILQMLDSFGRLNIFGIGNICCRNDAPPVIFSKVNNTAKAAFTVTTNVVKNQDTGKYQYQNIPCAVYGRQYNKEVFALLETVKQHDKVKFYGVFFPRKGVDKNGKEIDFSEVHIEHLELCTVNTEGAKVRRLKTDKDIDDAVKGATNKSKREKNYF